MREISLHILDMVQNSVAAGAGLVKIHIVENPAQDVFSFSVEDDGKGMDEDFLRKVADPFTTTRTTRKVGLGIPLLKNACEQAGGRLTLWSEPGKGTLVEAVFGYFSVDRQPLGDMAGTFSLLVSTSDGVNFVYSHETPKGRFEFDTREARRVLGEVDITRSDVVLWIKEYIEEGIKSIGGEKYEKFS